MEFQKTRKVVTVLDKKEHLESRFKTKVSKKLKSLEDRIIKLEQEMNLVI